MSEQNSFHLKCNNMFASNIHENCWDRKKKCRRWRIKSTLSKKVDDSWHRIECEETRVQAKQENCKYYFVIRNNLIVTHIFRFLGRNQKEKICTKPIDEKKKKTTMSGASTLVKSNGISVVVARSVRWFSQNEPFKKIRTAPGPMSIVHLKAYQNEPSLMYVGIYSFFFVFVCSYLAHIYAFMTMDKVQVHFGNVKYSTELSLILTTWYLSQIWLFACISIMITLLPYRLHRKEETASVTGYI